MKQVPFFLLISFFAIIASSQNNVSVDAFVKAGTNATAKYQDLNLAVADGYRKIGSDFPAMGEHWINIGLLFDGKFEPEHPEVLMYAHVSGRPLLLGVAYALPLLKDESPPDRPVPAEAWHDHFRSLDDETTLPLHHLHGQAGNGSRIAMLHAWLWSPNPAGMFAADNWAIPYLRLGFQPAETSDAAAKALSLVSGGIEYFSACIASAVSLPSDERKKVNAEFDRTRKAVELLLGKQRHSLSSVDVQQLSGFWIELWNKIDSSVSARSRSDFKQLSIR